MAEPSLPPDEKESAVGSERRFARAGEVVMWVLAMAAFALVMWLSYRSVNAPNSSDLRTPGVLILDAALATAVALVFAARSGALARPIGFWWCVIYGLWAAAAFRVAPVGMNDVLFDRNLANFDVPYILLGAGIKGFIAFLFALPYARRALSPEGRLGPDRDEEIWELATASVVVFFVVAVVMRFLA